MSDSNPGIILDESLASFFMEQIESVQVQRNASLRKDVEAYLVDLLARNALRVGQAGRKSPAFALELLEARERGTPALREVGDRALFVAGVVPHSLDRSAIDTDYVCSIGAEAYRSVFLAKRQLDLFLELADSFTELVSLVREVASPLEGDQPSSLISLYERWVETGDERAEKQLVQAGVRITLPEKTQMH